MSLINRMNANDRRRVDLEGWHIVQSRKRYNKLRKRGEYIKWSMEYNCWIWDFAHRAHREEER